MMQVCEISPYQFGVNSSGDIDYIRFSMEYAKSSMEVLRKSFFVNENVSIATEIAKNEQSCKDLELLCKYVSQGGVSILARNRATNEIVGVAFNLIQTPSSTPDEPTYFENFRDTVCGSDSSRGLMQFMIEVDSKFDVFAEYNVDCSLEIMFLAVLPEYCRRGIAGDLCKYSIELATEIKNGNLLDALPEDIRMLRPKVVTAIFTSLYSQKIGHNLGFKNVYEMSYADLVFQGKTFAERLNHSIQSTILAVKEL